MSYFHNATNVVVKDSQFFNQTFNGSKGAGLGKLLDASIPGASHDSSERYPPPTCHPGTRQEYIEKLTQLGLSSGHHTDRMIWLKGPAGVGKSAIAQSCADALHSKKRLGASFFFSRPNHRDNPDCFFTTLAYQLAVQYNDYGTHIDVEINRDPTIVKKSLPHQFNFLFATPFAQSAIWEEVGEQVIIIDGLDECARQEAQVDIIEIVAESVRARTTPFLWIFLSRLEPNIVTTFNLPLTKPVSQHIDLPVSRKLDTEILLYLADKLIEIGRQYDLTLPWPTEEEVWKLVDFCGGLFACANAIIYFIGTESPAGPVDQLYAVLRLAKRSALKSGKHPLSTLDELYTFIMERIPPEMLQTIQWILLTTRVPNINYAYESAYLLGLSELQLRSACRCLHSVISLDTSKWARITFYHTSFMDFLEDRARSGRFYIWSDCAVTMLEEVLRHLDQIQVDADAIAPGGYAPRLNLTWSPNKGHQSCYTDHIAALFKLLGSVHLDSDKPRPQILAGFDFRKLSFHFTYSTPLTPYEVGLLLQNLDSQLKLLQPCTFQNWWDSFLAVPNYKRYYIIGNGKKKARLLIEANTNISIEPYSPQRLKKWAKQFHEEPKQYKITSWC